MAVYVLTQKDADYVPQNTYWEGSFQEAYHDVLMSQQISNDVAKLSETNRVLDSVKDQLNISDLNNYKLVIDNSEKNRVITYKVTNQDPKMALDAVVAWTNTVSKLAKEVTDVENIIIVDEPKLPTEPSGPYRIIITLVSVISGLLIAVLIIFIKDALNKKILGPKEIVDKFNLKLLADIPRF